ncbi:MAG: AAA family ATPase [Candidatus Omnitrophota bacterium]|nr:AAA family ATPase [Candidatus Omnitrophota bacterium]
MKIAITGKGGVGKTTIAAGLALIIKEKANKVITIDCDPDMNLGLTLGFPNYEKITPICEMKELIAQRTEVESLDKPSTFFKLNPKVDDIPEKFAAEHNGIKLLVMGKVNKAGAGCMCPENTFIKNLLSHLILNQDEFVILDMVAGSEHLGRATAKYVDAFLIVTEPTNLSITTSHRIKNLCQEMGIKNIFFVGNKIRNDADKEFLKKDLRNSFAGFISFSKMLELNRGLFQFEEQSKLEFENIYQTLLNKVRA